MQLFPSVQSQFACTLFRFKNRQKYILVGGVTSTGGVTILRLNAIVSQRACNSPSLHVLYLGSKIVKNIFYYFWLDVQIYRGHTLTLISAPGGHYTTIKCNCFPACM